MTRSKQGTSTDAVLYLRVSTQEQAREGISLAAQEAKLRAYCALRGLRVVEVVTDAGVSGGKPMHSRVGGQRILDLVKRSAVAHVIAYKLDRLFRDCADCLTVTAAWDKKSIALHLVDLGGQTLDTTSAMGRFFLTVMAGAAELERNLICERTSEAMSYVRSQGHKTGGDVPYGYVVAMDGKTLVVHEQEQAMLEAIRSARQRGFSQRAVVAELTRQGFTTRKGTPLILRQVQRIMEQAQIA
jgi:DNA invertase Pin-like site-specific DNA recombinase